MCASELSASAQVVQDVLKNHGLTVSVVEMPTTTRTAKEAAESIGCTVAQIAKSLIFKTESHRSILVIASGANRVNENRLAEVVGEKIEKADPDFVRAHTGFAIGGVPPIGHREPIRTFLDSDLRQHEQVWAAAGTPFAVFSIAPHDLERISGGTWCLIR
jgi:Cys-tRNA(Pro) deacylase